MSSLLCIEDDKVLCPIHKKNIESYTSAFYAKDKGIKFFCSDCMAKNSYHYISFKRAQFKGCSQVQTALMSAETRPEPSLEKLKETNAIQDFTKLEFEYMIFDPNSKGYGTHNLAYMPDRNLLAVASFSGKITLWLIGDSAEYVSHLDLAKSIHYIKYFDISLEKKYLIICAESQVIIYDTIDMKFQELKTLICEGKINAVEYLESEDQIVTGGYDSSVRLWNSSTFEQESTIDLEKLGLKPPIYSTVFIKKEKKLILEHSEGITVTNLEGNSPSHYWMKWKKQHGLFYMEDYNRLLVGFSNEETECLDVDSLSPIAKFLHPKGSKQYGCNLRFRANQDQSQVISNSSINYPLVFGNKSVFAPVCQSPIPVASAVEVLSNQYRVAIADSTGGGVFIFRTNSSRENYWNMIRVDTWTPGLLNAKKKVAKKVAAKKSEKQTEESKMVIEEAAQKTKTKASKMEVEDEDEDDSEEEKTDNRTKGKGKGKKSTAQSRGRKETKDEERTRSRSKSKSVSTANVKAKAKPKKRK